MLPKIYYRVVVRTPKDHSRYYLAPVSKTFTDLGFAEKHRDKARQAGFIAKLYRTENNWEEIDEPTTTEAKATVTNEA